MSEVSRALTVVAPFEVSVIDQTALPFRTEHVTLRTAEQTAAAIKTMAIRGAPLIGVVAAFGYAMALKADASDETLERAFTTLNATRPTAVNLRWALQRLRDAVRPLPVSQRADAAWAQALAVNDDEIAACRRIGEHGLTLLRALPSRPLRILTHCNAGWLATGEWGTALAPLYLAHQQGLPVHVWVDETRPRNQGALTAWELAARGVPHTVLVDNAGGLKMLKGEVDACIVGADRIAANGDVCNKVGTYLKALAARDCGIPFFVAAPRSTIDRSLEGGGEVPIEERSGDEVRLLNGARLFAETTLVSNPAFDLTPARLVTKIITEAGIADANVDSMARLFFS